MKTSVLHFKHILELKIVVGKNMFLLFKDSGKAYIILMLLLIWSGHLQAKVYAVIVGVEQYDGTVSNLTAAVDDAERVYRSLLSGNSSDRIILLTDAQATKQNILKAMEIFRYAGPEDHIIFYFSGHGHTDMFCPTNFSGGKMALTHSEIRNAFRRSKAGVKLCIADACFAGSIQRSGGRSAPRNEQPSAASGNIIVFMSSRKNQTSLESRFYNTGFFTYYFLMGISGHADADKDRQITAYELYRYVRSNVVKDSQGTQTPVMIGQFDKNLVIATY